MTKYLMREPWACPPEPRTHGRVEVEGTDEVISQRYLALTALKALPNLPQHDPDLVAILPQHDLDCVGLRLQLG